MFRYVRYTSKTHIDIPLYHICIYTHTHTYIYIYINVCIYIYIYHLKNRIRNIGVVPREIKFLGKLGFNALGEITNTGFLQSLPHSATTNELGGFLSFQWQEGLHVFVNFSKIALA